MKKLTLLILILCAFHAYSQDNITVGGTFSVDLGRFNDRIEVMPSVALRTFSNTYLGIGITYAYYHQPNTA